MPAALSIFQQLPLHIAESISRYCISIQHDEKTFNSKIEQRKRVWTVLYNVSHYWRVLSIKFFSETLAIDISVMHGTGKLVFVNLPEGIDDSDMSYSYVKNAEIKVSEHWWKQDQESVHDFSSAWPEDLVLPSAISLSVDLAALMFQSVDEQDIVKNERFYWISQRIRTSMPKLQKVRINDDDIACLHDEESNRPRWKADTFLSTMLRNATALDLSTAVVELVSDLSFARDGTGLASIRCALLGQNVLFGSLIEKSVSTLESLDYYDGCFDNMRSLVIGQNGDPLVYPKLKNLIVGNDECGPFGDKVRIDSSIVPFPALRYLMWRSVYIFEDDALFRGNSDTLEYLDIEVDIDLVQTLHRLAVFAPGKYSRLCYVAVTYCQPSPDKYLEIDEYVRFVIGLLSPTTTVLSLTRYFHNMVVADADSLCFGNIQTLTLTGFCGTQYVLLDIVKLFPRMTRLTCAQGSLVADLRGRQIRSYDDLHTEYYPLSSSFRHWEAVPGLVRDVKAIAHMALLFTILCPNFELTYVSSEFSKKFEQFMRRTIRSGRHKDHADRLQHLLRIMD